MEYQCKYINFYGKRCEHNALRSKDYCAEHTKRLSSYSVGTIKHTPDNLPYTKYDVYIHSSVWVERAKQERIKNPKCSLCNRRGELHVHHRTYVRLGNEAPNDLVVLCKDCHTLFHSVHVYDPSSGCFIRFK